MPKYDFKCNDCGTTVELTLSINDKHSATCDNCGKEMSKVFSATPAHFKGGGWGGK